MNNSVYQTREYESQMVVCPRCKRLYGGEHPHKRWRCNLCASLGMWQELPAHVAAAYILKFGGIDAFAITQGALHDFLNELGVLDD